MQIAGVSRVTVTSVFVLSAWEWQQRCDTERVTQVHRAHGCCERGNGAERNASKSHNSPYFNTDQQTWISWLLLTHPRCSARADCVRSGRGKTAHLLLRSWLLQTDWMSKLALLFCLFRFFISGGKHGKLVPEVEESVSSSMFLCFFSFFPLQVR